MHFHLHKSEMSQSQVFSTTQAKKSLDYMFICNFMLIRELWVYMYIAHISTHTTSTMYIEVMNQIMRHFRQLSKHLRGLYLLIHANFSLFLASKLIAHKETEIESSNCFLRKMIIICAVLVKIGIRIVHSGVYLANEICVSKRAKTHQQWNLILSWGSEEILPLHHFTCNYFFLVFINQSAVQGKTPLWGDLVKILTRKPRHASSLFLECTDFKT